MSHKTPNLAYEEKPCHGNLRMSHPYCTYRSVSEAGEFGLSVILLYEH